MVTVDTYFSQEETVESGLFYLLVEVELKVSLDLREVEAVDDVHVFPQLPGV